MQFRSLVALAAALVASGVDAQGDFGSMMRFGCAQHSIERLDPPKNKCPGGLRVNINFANCWDGKNLDSDDHKSHVSSGYNGCPSSHPVQIPQIMLETVFDTGLFTGEDGIFTWAQGDATGYGYHADYVFGWQGDSLQKALNQRCSFDGNCAALTTQDISTANKCTKKASYGPPVLDRWIRRLPGRNVVTSA